MNSKQALLELSNKRMMLKRRFRERPDVTYHAHQYRRIKLDHIDEVMGLHREILNNTEVIS